MLKFLFSTIRFSLAGGDYSTPSDSIDWEQLYRICKLHKIEAIVCHGLERLPEKERIPADIMKKFQSAWQLEVARDTVQTFAKAELFQAFEQAEIDYLPLKGIHMKQFYPRPDLRMMSDFDILYRPEQEEKMDALIKKMGYEHTNVDAEEKVLVYMRKPFMVLEMHHDLMDEGSISSTYYKNPWKLSIRVDEQTHEYKFSWEDFYVFMIAHLAKHFLEGGSGIRSIIDIWLFERQMSDKLDWSYLQEELSKQHLWKFTEQLRQLVQIWFEGAPSSEVFDDLTDFFMKSGVYGSIQNAKNQSVALKDKNAVQGQMRLWMKTIFLPAERMKEQYRYLEKMPFLLPVAWLHRIFRTLLTKRGRAEQVLSSMTTDTSEIKKIQRVMDAVGFMEENEGMGKGKKDMWF